MGGGRGGGSPGIAAKGATQHSNGFPSLEHLLVLAAGHPFTHNRVLVEGCLRTGFVKSNFQAWTHWKPCIILLFPAFTLPLRG